LALSQLGGTNDHNRLALKTAHPSKPVTKDYRTTQNVRRFLAAQLGAEIHLDRPFMAWIRSGAPRNMGDIADELDRRRPGKMTRG
jgi:Domain of unknown function (DUF6434)